MVGSEAILNQLVILVPDLKNPFAFHHFIVFIKRISIIGKDFTVLQLLDVTLNMVVLFSLTLALGMLVDNAIVIVANIYRYQEQGGPRIEAAKKASSEVAYPVIGSTLTTVAAFSPMLYWPGIMGEFMSYLPLTLIVTLTSSLFVALVINPALSAIFIKLKDPSNVPIRRVSAEEIENQGEEQHHH